MKQIGSTLILLLMLFSCGQDKVEITNPAYLMPSNSEVVFKINALNDFKAQKDSQGHLFNPYSDYFDLVFGFSETQNFQSPIYISFFEETKNVPSYKLVSKKIKSDTPKDSIPITKSNKRTHLLDSVEVNSTYHFFKEINGYIVASNLKEHINTHNTRDESATSNYSLFNTVSDDVVASVVFNNKNSIVSKLLLNNWEYSAWNATVLDLDLSKTANRFNGILSYSDSITSAFECFKNTIPQNINSTLVIPRDINKVISLAFDDFETFETNRRALLPTDSLYEEKPFLNYANEIAKADDYLIMHSLDPKIMLESIEFKTFSEEYRGIDIYEVQNEDFLEGQFYPFFNTRELRYLALVENFVVWSKDLEYLKNLISSFLTNTTLRSSEAFENISNDLSNAASLFVFENSNKISLTFETDLKGYDANVVQFINEDKFAHINGIIQKFKKRPKSAEVAENFSTKISSPLISSPQIVKNHITKGYDILVQDTNNELSLISNSGKVLWEKRIDDKILGKVEQIDMYKNGRLQVAFVTPKKLYVLDRNGKDVSPFPLKFNDEITQPLSVFDYDKNRNYRLLVSQGKDLLMYDAKGKSVKGFNYKSTGVLTSQPKHFRIGSRDYIVFKTGDKLKILNRRGKTRINIGETVPYSNNEIYLYKNKFTSTTGTGELVQFDTKGKLSKTVLNLPEDHNLATTSKTLVSLSENILQIKSRRINLDYGDYTAPRIFYLNDKIYVTTTDLETKKVYLFDSQAKPIPNFPVYGTSAAVLQNIDKDNALELMTQDGIDKVLVYKIY